MTRSQLIKIAYNRSAQLTVSNPFYLAELATYTLGFLRNDLGMAGDITTRYVNGDSFDVERKAIIKAKDEGILAGLDEVMWFYKAIGIEAKALKSDGNLLSPGDVIIELVSRASNLLAAERCGLNLLHHMSGIATSVYKITKEFKRLKTNSAIAGSRKQFYSQIIKQSLLVGAMPTGLGCGILS